MSMTEHLGSVATTDSGLSPELEASFQRIQKLARRNNRQYAVDKTSKPAAAPAHTTIKSKLPPRKKKQPYFYNPSNRD